MSAEEIRLDVLGKPATGSGPVADNPRLTVAKTAYEAADGAHAIAVVTEWDEFKKLDYAKMLGAMHKPAFIFDGRNILDLAKLEALGFRTYGIGK